MVADIIKIKYTKLGYIKKNYPYHLISDEEMFNAFILVDEDNPFESNLIDPEVRFFDIYYPNPFSPEDVYTKTIINSEGEKEEIQINVYDEYIRLKQYIQNTIKDYLAHYGTPDESKYLIPDWIYTYMLGEVIYTQSDYKDIEDMLELLGCSNNDNEFTKEACISCYAVSSKYISTLTTGNRPPTCFGEPHVIKNLRLGA